MSLKVLFIGGTGNISLPCVAEAVAAGHQRLGLQSGEDVRRSASERDHDRRRSQGHGLSRARASRLRRGLPVHHLHARADGGRHCGFRRRDRPVHLHLVSLGLREAAAALCDHGRDARDQSLTGHTARTRSPAKAMLKALKRAALDHRAAEPHRALDAADDFQRRRRGRSSDARGKAGDPRRRRRNRLDADAMRGFRRAIRQAVRQAAQALGEDFHITSDHALHVERHLRHDR